MNRINAVRIIQRALLALTLVAVAHAARPFSVRGVTRHLFRTTQSLSLFLPGAATCTLEQADYVATILDGSFRGVGSPTEPSSAPDLGMRESDMARAEPPTSFNPEYDFALPSVSPKSRCPLEAQREAQTLARKMTVEAKTAPAARRSRVIRDAVAVNWRTRETGKSVFSISGGYSLKAGVGQAIEQAAVVELPQVRHRKASLVLSNELPGMPELVKSIAAQSRPGKCTSPALDAIKEVTKVRVSLVMAEEVDQKIRGELRIPAEALRQVQALKPALACPAGSRCRRVQPVMFCTQGGQIIKC